MLQMSGWIKLDREITSHWIFKDEWKFRNWIDLLTLVNHSEQKVNIKGTVLTCKRGETLCSLDTLARRWNCDKSKVRRFLKLLESDSMIELKSEHITTRLTICKYDTYQGERNEDETQVKHKRNASETQMTPNKNDKKERMLFIVPSLQEVSAYCQERNNNVDSQKFFDFYESKGWMVGKNKMKDWKAAVRTWEDKSKSNQVEEPKELLLARKLGLC
jgi:DNA replication protein DnaD